LVDVRSNLMLHASPVLRFYNSLPPARQASFNFFSYTRTKNVELGSTMTTMTGDDDDDDDRNER